MAFNVQNMAQFNGLIAASKALALPVIAQMSAKYALLESRQSGLARYARLAGQARVYLHLDHCTDDHLIHHCIRQGFDSVMFDGSDLPFAENVRHTNQITALAHESGCLVEAELGRIGGVEDGVGGTGADNFSAEQLAEFCTAVDADLIAPAIGNAHGFYSDPAQVRIDYLPTARTCLRKGQFLVLHGGTGLKPESLMEAVRAGVAKINISTHLKQRTQELLKDWSNRALFDEAELSRGMESGLIGFYCNYIEAYTK
jgi:ketose-bisphosphate aldolase